MKKIEYRICFFIPFGLNLFKIRNSKKIGGAEVQLNIISKNLSKFKEFDISVILGDFNLNKPKVEKLTRNLKLYVTYPLKKKFLNHIKRPLILFITLLKIKPDLLVQRTASINTGLCALFCKLLKKNFIFSIANKPNVNGKDEEGWSGKFYRYGLEHADFIVAQSYEQIEELEKYKRRKFHNIKVIRSGYEITNVIKTKKNYILWVARALHWKRPELFLKLAQAFPEENFVMVLNKGDDLNYWNYISKKASNLSNLMLIEFVPFNEIDEYFRHAKIFVNTSIYEGFPNTFIQAFKNKTPVLSLKADPDNILSENQIGFSCNDDFNDMKKKLRRLSEDPILYKNYCDNAFKYVKRNHDIEKVCFEWKEIIKKIILNDVK